MVDGGLAMCCCCTDGRTTLDIDIHPNTHPLLPPPTHLPTLIPSFLPDTPVFELKETLTGKYGEDSKLIYDLADQVHTYTFQREGGKIYMYMYTHFIEREGGREGGREGRIYMYVH
jgi:hypothetical protein